ncbi:MAG: radical SAM protein [Spirochaetes bacterium]|nr:radical SAM protein [Spirochaetota bacterium]
MYKILLISTPVPEPMKWFYNTNFALIQHYIQALIKKNIINKKLFNIITLNENILGRLNNEGIINLIKKYTPDIILFSCYLWNIERFLYISKKVKEMFGKNIFTISGGPEIRKENNFLYKNFLEGYKFDLYFDSDYLFDLPLFFNNIDSIIKKFILNKDPLEPIFFSKIKISLFYKSINVENIENVNKKLFKFEKYFINEIFKILSEKNFNSKIVFCEIERGCFQKCDFCQYAKNIYKQTSIDENIFLNYIYNIIKNNKKLKEIYFLAPTLNYNKNLFYTLLNYFINLNNSFILENTNNNFLENNNRKSKSYRKIKLFGEFNPYIFNEEDIKLLSDANFKEIEIGVQSLNFNIKNKNLIFNKEEKLKSLFLSLKKYKIKPIIDFIIGLPEDNYNSWVSTISYLENNNMLRNSNFYHLLVLPGTKIREKFEKSGFKYLDEPPYYAIETSNYNFDDIKKFYSYLEFEKDISYFEPFEFNKNFPFLKVNITKINQIESFFYNLQNISYISFTILFEISMPFNLNFFNSFINKLYKIIIKKKECFIKIFFYFNYNYDFSINTFLNKKSKKNENIENTNINQELKNSDLENIYKILIEFKKNLFGYKNYFDKFHECINYNSDEIFSKNITILSTLNFIDHFIKIFYLDFNTTLFIENFLNINNKLQKAKEIYKEYGFFSYVDNDMLKSSSKNKELKKLINNIGFIKIL